MEFFLDSGIFVGRCDPKDKWYEKSKKLFKNYPRQTNNYYSAKKVKEELKMNRLQSIKKKEEGYDNKALRMIYQCIKRRLKQMEKLVEYEEKNQIQFNPLVDDIKGIMNYKQNDAIIVTNAIFWSCGCNPMGDHPTLITIDYYDIVIKADKIIEQAELKCNRNIPLKIKPLWDI